MMTPAERYAALITLRDAVKKVVEEQGEQVVQHGSDTGADRWRTEYGTVVIATRDDKATAGGCHICGTVQHSPSLLTWAKENHPGEVMEMVRPGFVKAVLDGAEIADGQVIDPATGEVLTWASIRSGSNYVTTPKAEAKEQSVERWSALLHDRLDAIAGTRPALPEENTSE